MKKQLTYLLATGAMLVVPGMVLGQSNFVGGGDNTSWEDAANWDAGIPVDVAANVTGGFAPTLGTDQSIFELDLVGDQSNGTASLDHSAGILTSSNWMKVGGNFEGTANEGTYSLSGTASAVGQVVTHIGFAQGNGTLSLSGSASFEAPGEFGPGSLSIACGSPTEFGGEVGNDSFGTLNIADNATVAIGNLNIAAPGSVASVNQTGGSLSSNNWVALANFGPGGAATYNISGGSVTANNGNFAVGQEGSGTLNVSGTAVVTQARTTQADDVLFVAQDPTSTGLLSISGSQASVSGEDFRVARDEGSEATLSWTADAGGVTPIVSGDNTEFGAGTANLVLDLSADPASATAGTEYLLIDNGAAVSGTFTGIAEGDTVSIGGGNEGTLSYVGGDGFDIVVTAVGGDAVLGDFSGDGLVDCNDIDLFAGTFGTVAEGSPASRDLTGDGTVDMADALELIQTLVVTSPNGRTGTFLGDLNCDGEVDVLGDAFVLIANLNDSGVVYTQGDLDFDGSVTVLGDAFLFIANLNSSNDL